MARAALAPASLPSKLPDIAPVASLPYVAALPMSWQCCRSGLQHHCSSKGLSPQTSEPCTSTQRCGCAGLHFYMKQQSQFHRLSQWQAQVLNANMQVADDFQRSLCAAECAPALPLRIGLMRICHVLTC